MSTVVSSKKRKDLRTTNNDGERKRLHRSDEPIIDRDLISAKMKELRLERCNSESQLDAQLDELKRDAIGAIMLHADALIPVNLECVFPTPQVFAQPMEHLIERSRMGPLMHYLDVMVIAAYSHCVRKYGSRFTDMLIISNTFKNLMSMSWQESTEVATAPSVVNMKRLFFYVVLSCENGLQKSVANDYKSVESLARFTSFMDNLKVHTEMLFQTPFSSHQAVSNNNVSNVISNYIHHVMQSSILALQ